MNKNKFKLIGTKHQWLTKSEMEFFLYSRLNDIFQPSSQNDNLPKITFSIFIFIRYQKSIRKKFPLIFAHICQFFKNHTY